MHRTALFALAGLALVVGAPAAFGFDVPAPNAPYPTRNQIESRYRDSVQQPYAMTYSDQAARRLGVEDGKWEAFGTRTGDSGRLSGGINTSGAVLRLTW